MFEAHPELFFAIVATVGFVGGWAGSTVRSFVNKTAKHNKYMSRKDTYLD